jgi:Tfp pilus assembly protein PilX
MRPQLQSGRAQRGNTLILVLIALSLLLLSAIVILRSSGVGMLVAGNVVSRTAGNQAAEVAINDALTAIQTALNNGTFDPDTGAGLPAGSYFPRIQVTDTAGIPRGITWPSPTQVGNYQLQWVIDRLCSTSPVTDASSQCRTAPGPQTGNSIGVSAVQFRTPPRVFYRVTAMVTAPKASVSFVQVLIEL